MILAGIDFGAKLAGTTAITWNQDSVLHTIQCAKGTDADAWLLQQIEQIQPGHIFIDAPLSLPAAYFGLGSDFAYREADREVKAMSPMFLGGLTARAMQFAHRCDAMGIKITEVYPAGLVRQTPALKPVYDKKKKDSLPLFLQQLATLLPNTMQGIIGSYHAADSILCWWSGHRYVSAQAAVFGNADEGQIWV